MSGPNLLQPYFLGPNLPGLRPGTKKCGAQFAAKSARGPIYRGQICRGPTFLEPIATPALPSASPPLSINRPACFGTRWTPLLKVIPFVTIFVSMTSRWYVSIFQMMARCPLIFRFKMFKLIGRMEDLFLFARLRRQVCLDVFPAVSSP